MSGLIKGVLGLNRRSNDRVETTTSNRSWPPHCPMWSAAGFHADGRLCANERKRHAIRRMHSRMRFFFLFYARISARAVAAMSLIRRRIDRRMSWIDTRHEELGGLPIGHIPDEGRRVLYPFRRGPPAHHANLLVIAGCQRLPVERDRPFTGIVVLHLRDRGVVSKPQPQLIRGAVINDIEVLGIEVAHQRRICGQGRQWPPRDGAA